MEETKIDLVITYVNNNEPVWKNAFIKTCTQYNYYRKMGSMIGQRFDDIGLFETNLKLIMKNMPWLNKIYLVVSNKEQVPSYAKKICGDKLKVVMHHEFIYSQYLPTFNSTTIEMFLWNIKGLEEHFIYINDDMFPVNKLEPSDFYEDNKIKIDFITDNIESVKSNQFRKVCINSYVDIAKRVKHSVLANGTYDRPLHSFTPMIKSNCKKCYQLLGTDITDHLGRFRSDTQHNQYIYPNYENLVVGTLKSPIKFKYLELDFPLEEIKQGIMENQIVCINDSHNKNGIDIKAIKNMLGEQI